MLVILWVHYLLEIQSSRDTIFYRHDILEALSYRLNTVLNPILFRFRDDKLLGTKKRGDVTDKAASNTEHPVHAR